MDGCVMPGVRGVALGADAVTAGLVRRLLAERSFWEGDVVVGELGLCQGRSRIDVCVVGRELHGYEVKGDGDSLRRLEGQVEMYGRVFDRVTLVCTPRHLEKALDAVPAWWGVLKAGPGRELPVFRQVRKGRRNKRPEVRALAEFIWREDALSLLLTRGMANGLGKKARAYVWDRLAEVLTLEEMGDVVRSNLRETVIDGKRGVLLGVVGR